MLAEYFFVYSYWACINAENLPNTITCAPLTAAGLQVGFGEIDRSVPESGNINVYVDLSQSNADNITLRLFPVTLDEFRQFYATSRIVTNAVQERIDKITDPAECKDKLAGRVHVQ